VFAPTNAAFAQLPAPFKNAASISAITDPVQIAALANILKYHVTATRYFAWDFGIFSNITTLATAPNNTVKGILGFNAAAIKGKSNNTFSNAQPVNILATNGVVHVLDQVLLP
jgi:transforming growth factor-beta-induced protein